MKKVILLILLSVFYSQAKAAVVACTTNLDFPHTHLVVGENYVMDCAGLKINGSFYPAAWLKANIRSIGPGLSFTASAVAISCTTPLKRLTKSKFYGIKVSASLIAGATVGVFANRRGGTCLLTGLEFGMGAGIAGTELSFEGRN